MKYRVTVEALDEEGQPPECRKTSCQMCGGTKQSVDVEVNDPRPDDLARWAGQAATTAVERMMQARDTSWS